MDETTNQNDPDGAGAVEDADAEKDIQATDVEAADAGIQTGEGAPETDTGTEGEGAQKAWWDGLNLKEDVLKQAKRFRTLEAFVDSWHNQRVRLSEREKISFDLPEDEAAAAEVRRKLGVPDDPSGYEVRLERDLEDTDKELLDDFLKTAHGNVVPPKMVQAFVDWYFDKQVEHEQAFAQIAYDTTQENVKALKSEYGAEYSGAMNTARAFIETHVGQEVADELLETTLIDGSKLKTHPAFVKLAVTAGRMTLDDDALVTAGDVTSSVNVEERIEALRELQFSNPAKYVSQEVQDELLTLVAKREARKRR